MGALAVALTFGAVFLGAFTQRMTGLGFALVAAPLLVATVGPADGVVLGNVLSAVLCLVVLVSAWRHVRWGWAALMIAPALATVPLGAFVVRHTPSAPMTVVVGALALIAVLVTMFARNLHLLRGRGGAVAAGALSGFMNATAGVGGPPLAIHAASQPWRREAFIGTSQLFLFVINALSVATKGLPSVSTTSWIGCGVALLLGVAVGHRVAPLVPDRVARPLVLGLAAVGSVVALIRGILAL